METGMNMPVNELTQGPEQESELSASIELCLSLAQEILASIDKLLSVAQSGGCPNLAAGPPDSPPSPRSPRSEITRQPFKAERTEMISKRRKLGSAPEAEAEGPLDDGYIWKKFGQKYLVRTKTTRAYYKCTHRGCLAKKQAQRSDDNPAIFDVTYRGTHTCDQKPSLPAAAESSKWTSLVKLGSGPEAEGPLDDDGYSWRKNGQKYVRGAKYSRDYYRCTHCYSQGCLAKKQAHRSDDNLAIFDVTYMGTHTCDQTSALHHPHRHWTTVASAVSPKHSNSSVTSELKCFSSSPGRESSYGETPSLQASESFALESGNNSAVIDLDIPFDQDSDPGVLF